MALAKGGLTPYHVLILPVSHCAASVDLSATAATEVERFRAALRSFAASRDCVCVFFERNVRSQHMQIQAVDVPRVMAARLPDAFESIGTAQGVSFERLAAGDELRSILAPGSPYFLVEFDDGLRLLHRVHATGLFPLQFGRDVLCSADLLNIPERVDWRRCVPAKDAEARMAQAFRDQFKPYDFTAMDGGEH